MIITCCPHCATAFRVTPEQLKTMHGKVRCGQCRQVFNAIDTLQDLPAEPAPATEPLADLLEPEIPPGEPAIVDKPEDKILVEPQAFRGPLLEPITGTQGRTPQPEPLLHQEPIIAPRRRTWPWAFATGLALLLLQLILHFRVELSVLLPDAKPVLQALCEPLACDVPLPRKADLISIESSDLRPDADNPARLVLAATLKNRAPFAQNYPHLELTLTDTSDQPILRKVLAPSDYLPKGLNMASGFAKHSEINMNLALVHDHAANSVASGYRLYLFYP